MGRTFTDLFKMAVQNIPGHEHDPTLCIESANKSKAFLTKYSANRPNSKIDLIEVIVSTISHWLAGDRAKKDRWRCGLFRSKTGPALLAQNGPALPTFVLSATAGCIATGGEAAVGAGVITKAHTLPRMQKLGD